MSLCELEVFNREKLCVFCQHAPSARELLALPDWVNPLITYDVVSKPRFTQQQMNSAITAKMLSNPRSLASMRKAQMKQGMRDVAAAHRKTERTAAVAAVAAAASAAKEKRRARTADDDDDDDDYEEDDCSLDEADAEELEEIDFINEVDEDEREIFDIDEENAVDAHDMALDED